MSYEKPSPQGSWNDEQAPPSISPLSSLSFNQHVDERRFVATVSQKVGPTERVREAQNRVWKPEIPEEIPEVSTPIEDDDAIDNTGNKHSLGSLRSQYNIQEISGQRRQPRIPRVPVPLRPNIHTPSPSLGKLNASVSEEIWTPEEDRLVGEARLRKVRKWGRGWKLPPFTFSRKKSEVESLTMNSAPIAGTDYSMGDPEAARGQNDETSYWPKPYSPEFCPSKKNIQSDAWHWLSKVVVTLSLYSTVMSGIWLFAATVQPRWGRQISSNMGLAPSTATLITAWLAKTIEMSFVTTFITFLGQVLTRRAIARDSRGATLAEMSMRSWVIQPGSLLTHFRMLKYAAPTVLGVLCLISAIVAAFYTTASDAMVAPKLKYGSWEHKTLSGYVRASYANAKYIRLSCPAMLTAEDQDNAASACTEVMVSGESYRNLQSFMQVWTDINNNGSTTVKDLSMRPAGIASLHGNTTLHASWIETHHSDVAAHFEDTGRIINNVTMAMPHPGVASAAMSPLNGILQPDDLSGVGEYAIKAGVVSPAVNVMCVNMDRDELGPLVYTEWPNANTSATGVGSQRIGWSNWTSELPSFYYPDGKQNFLNRTVVDDIFRWGPEYQRRPPVFQMYPADYNTVTNATVLSSDAMYIMGKSPVLQNYTLCELRSWVSPNCSTQFNISGISGSKMAAYCEDPNDRNSYLRSFAADQDWAAPSSDWRWLAEQWGLASDLNGGLRNSNPSNSRILTQLILTGPQLPPYLPSMAEALAVFASSTLVMGSIDTPFVHYWEYFKPGNMIGKPGAVHQFNASISTQQFTSGHMYAWQGIFYIVLAFMFLINVLCFVYILFHARLLTDFTEAHNLFALALNSGQTEHLKGSCGGGPEGSALGVPWRVGYIESHNHYFAQQVREDTSTGSTEGPNTSDGEVESRRLPGANYNRLSSGRGWL